MTIMETHNNSASRLPLRPYAAILSAGLMKKPGRVLTPCKLEAPAEALFMIPFPCIRKVSERGRILRGELTEEERLLLSNLGEGSWVSGLDCVAVSSRSKYLLKRRLMEARMFPTKLVLMSCMTLASGQQQSNLP